MSDRTFERTHREPCDCPTCTRAVTEARAGGMAEGEKAFGGCKNCYGKGYNTQMVNEVGAEDFGGDGYETGPHVRMVFCRCVRGKQLKKLVV